MLSEPSAVTREAAVAFQRDGFYIWRALVDRNLVDEALSWLTAQDPASLTKSWTEKEPGVRLAVFSVAHVGEHPIARIATAPAIVEIASALMESPVYLWASKVNVKAAWCGAVEYYHQDLVYWKDRGYPRTDLLTCMVFMHPHTVSNAALHLIPGTHRLGVLDHEPFVNINGLAKYMVPPATLSRLNREHGLVAVEGEPGDAVFFHAGVVHGSSHNSSAQARTVVISQLNVVGNEPQDAISKTRQFNLRRAELELREAERRHAWFKRKYDEQSASNDVTFTAPISDREQQSRD